MGNKASKSMQWRVFKAMEKESHFTIKELQSLHQIWEKLAHESEDDYSLQPDQMKTAFEKVGIRIDADSAFWKHMFNVFDKAGNHKVDFREFAMGLSTFSRGTLAERLDFSFQVYDLKEDNKISAEEMKAVLHAMYKAAHFGKSPNEEVLKEIDQFITSVFEDSDASHTGSLTQEEYRDAVIKHPKIAEYLAV